jgi:amidase
MTVFTEQFELGLSKQLIVGIKDNIDIAGLSTCAGSKALFEQSKANEHADVVKKIIRSGAKIVGKLNMHELAFGMTGVNEYYGTPINYVFPKYITGGSSSGCAVAVAEGKVDFSIGTDTGGSIRVPAACCGVFGLKPTFGRISRKGVIPQDTTLDCVGPLSLSASGLIDAMSCIDSNFGSIPELKNIRLGRIAVKAEYSIQVLVSAALNKDFITTGDVNLAHFTDAFDAALKLMNYEMWSAFGHLLETGKLGRDVAKRLDSARNINSEIVGKAHVTKELFTSEIDLALKGYDALVLPTLASFPLYREEALAGKNDLNISSLTRPFNLSGHPAISIPLDNTLGKPVSMQLIGAKGKDELICAIAKKISEIRNH